MKYLIAFLLSGCAFVYGPCYLIIDLTEKFLACEEGGAMVVIPANILEIDNEGLKFKK